MTSINEDANAPKHDETDDAEGHFLARVSEDDTDDVEGHIRARVSEDADAPSVSGALSPESNRPGVKF